MDRRSPIFGSSQVFGGELDSSLENDIIKLICGLFPTYDADGTEAGIEYVVSHGVDDGLKPVVLPQVHPQELGAKRDAEGWYLE